MPIQFTKLVGDWRHIIEDYITDPGNAIDGAGVNGTVTITPVLGKGRHAPKGWPTGSVFYTLATLDLRVYRGLLRDANMDEDIQVVTQIDDFPVAWRAKFNLTYKRRSIPLHDVVFGPDEVVAGEISLSSLIATQTVPPEYEGSYLELMQAIARAENAVEDAQEQAQVAHDASALAVLAAAHAGRIMGAGSPEGNRDAPIGTIYVNTSSGVLWHKTTAEGSMSGWKALSGALGTAIPLSSDLNTFIDAGDFYASNAVAASCTNAPFTNAFTMQTRPGAAAQRVQIATEIRGASIEAETKFRMSIGTGTWSAWKRYLSEKDLANFVSQTSLSEQLTAARWHRSTIATGADLNAHTSLGIFWANATTAATVLNTPSQVAGQAFSLEVIPGTTNYFTQELRTYRGTTVETDHLYRWTINAGSSWSPWKRFLTDKDLLAPDLTAPKGHRRDKLKHTSRLRRGGVIGTGGATPVALTFDHGFANFRDKVLPHLKRLGFPCTVATQPAQAGTGENAGTTWSDLQSWGLNHGVEYAHHAWTHSDLSDALTNIPGLIARLTDSIATHAAEMPELASDAFIMPGVSGTKWGGFNGGNADSSWWDHPAGRILTDNFPVISGTMPGYAIPMLGGEDQTWTSYRWSWDTPARADEFMTHVANLQGSGMGIATFVHPSVLDGAGNTSEAKLVQVLEWLAAERDAGRVEVLTLSGWAYADTSTNRRVSLGTWSGNTATIPVNPMFNWVKGAQLMVEVTAASAGPLTLTATSNAGGLNATVTYAAEAGKKYRLVFSVPRSASTVTVTAPGSNRSIWPV